VHFKSTDVSYRKVRMNETETLLLSLVQLSNTANRTAQVCIVSISVSKELLNFNLSGNLPCWLWQWKEKGGFRTVSEVEIVDRQAQLCHHHLSAALFHCPHAPGCDSCDSAKTRYRTNHWAKYRLRRMQTRKVTYITYIKEGSSSMILVLKLGRMKWFDF
jgi:hypothetical protein